ncbi:hypothetical protein P691DRAFT_31531 [Macrolepiota fuliginosa MF-IS2]|uniref:Uncharacterized protein n=1 Tax=Macrolepiota fuliginosa MF-IS2 TaxID=1400762 RepID=A0A9P5XC81_9AGAR|nr:hypothetical protein P691DRAFT_31531 [Macrolepiota fuliginosa MF-IS2]
MSCLSDFSSTTGGVLHGYVQDLLDAHLHPPPRSTPLAHSGDSTWNGGFHFAYPGSAAAKIIIPTFRVTDLGMYLEIGCATYYMTRFLGFKRHEI